jgi:hypothetical protein
MKRIILIVALFASFATQADQYYQAPDHSLHFLSTNDLAAGGYRLLPAGVVPITTAQAAAIQATNNPPANPTPNAAGFVSDVKAALGGIIPSNTLAGQYPLFFPAIQSSDWADVQALILDAQIRGIIGSTQYAAIKAAAISNNIPIALP